MLAVAGLGTLGLASQIRTTYYLPPRDTGNAVEMTALFEPAVVGTVVAVLVVVGVAAHLVVAVRRDPPRWMSLAALVLTLLVACGPVVVAGMDHPVF